MATWYLLNTIKLRGPNGVSVLSAGELINDQFTLLSAILAAGGQVAPSGSASVAAAAVIAQKKKKQGASAAELNAIMLAAVPAPEANRTNTTSVAGATVAAAAAIAPNNTFTPVSTGKARVRAWVNLAALAAGTFRALVKQGATTIGALAAVTGAASQAPFSGYVEFEVTGLALYTPVTFSFVSTAGDATVALGAGATGPAAGLSVQELP